MTTPVLHVEGLHAGYDSATVVRDLTLAVNSGEVVALLGPNGAGKTTTLQTISGLVRATAGRVSVNGLDISAHKPSDRAMGGIAHVPEGRGIFAGLTVAEHFRLGHPRERLDADVAYQYFPKLAELSGRRAGVLSGGEQQMLAVGRALARKPQLMLLDELSLGLAPVVVEQLLPIIRKYADETGCGVLLVEQHVNLALGIADRAYLLAHGTIQLDRPAAELREDRTLIAASYLGKPAQPEAGAGTPPGDD
ncbi:High-affinity branched-chain amino acid transport ATP-binding protein LivF [Frankia sp. Hr75.2]|nr:High-affinity branched-chain amino acid transport ATP-binding protein LivF [Frankia sp. Hr75.2]